MSRSFAARWTVTFAVASLLLLQVVNDAFAQEATPVYEGWNEVVWNGTAAEGTPAVLAALDRASDPRWSAVASFQEGEWKQTFSWAPIAELNTLELLAPGEDYWLFVDEEGLFDPLAPGADVVATFLVAEVESYRILVTGPEDLDILYRLRAGLPAPSIPWGLIVHGESSVNTPWSWHIDPASLEFADFTIEVCDGLPSHVEDGTLTWDAYCPWSARLVDMEIVR